MVGGYRGRIGFVDLTKGEIREENLDETIARRFIGGYGLGVRILFERQKKGIDPLGPENILGFTTGPLTGTKTPSGGRYMAVAKSPLTGGCGDGNSGGYFGDALKSAGWDAIFFSGISPMPRYLLVTKDRLELRDASSLWGKDTIETEEAIQKELGKSKLRVASIGPASERLSLITGIVNDKGRIAARSGLGAVMGSKGLKAVAAYGTGKSAVADKETLDQWRKRFLNEFRESGGFPKMLKDYGTCALTRPLVAAGAMPVKNWILAGEQAFQNLDRIDGDAVIQYQKKRFGCANCPIACGGLMNVPNGAYPVEEVHKVEYETVAAFGTMCMNDNLPAIIKLNDMCNRSGLDTISAGTVLAFAMECFENGIISSADTDGIELTWGNSEAMIAMTNKIICREGLGDILADGVKVAAAKIGGGAEACAMHVGGQEPGFHNALFLPSRGTGYVCDPTPGRHTAASAMSRIEAGGVSIAPYPELQIPENERYAYKGKGPISAKVSNYMHVGNCAGVCQFPMIFFGNFRLLEFLNAATGWNMNMEEALETGARIQTLRQCFNIREGIRVYDVKLPLRLAGLPPKEEGPLAGITMDIDSLAHEYREAMGWDPHSGAPEAATLERLGLRALVENHG